MKILVVENGNEIYTSEEMLDLAKGAISKKMATLEILCTTGG